MKRQEEEQLYAAQANSSSWAQVYAQIESITKTKNAKDTSRMKAILFALKNDVKAE